MPACCSCSDVFQYETNKVIRIQSRNYGSIKWILHMVVFSYVSFALLSDKLYQLKEPLISSVHTKVKGIAEVKEELIENGQKKVTEKVFDTADYTFPLQGNSFFVMTNFLKTEGQVQGLCPEQPSRRTICNTDRNCKKGWMDPQSKGIQTGKCVVYKGTQKTCEVSAWCPTETVQEPPRPALLNVAENFTVLIKNNIDFPGHNYTTRNIFPGLNITCTFHKTRDPQCPVFRLGDIFQETGDNFSEVAIQGGIMGIEIYWDCNLDKWFHRCRPKYSFRRLDDKNTKESFYPGYNFRYAKYYKENNVEKRTLIKVFGIRFDILVFGTGGKFNFIKLIVNIGSTLSYFGLATFFIDFLINTYSSKCCRSRIYPCCKCCEPCAVNEYYYEKKCESIMEPKSTLKYVSFVDEPHISMVDQQLLRRSLQNVEGEEIPRPPMDFAELSRLPLSVHKPPHISEHQEELELLGKTGSPEWCQCGSCLPSELPEESRCMEELCCRKAQGPCITNSPLFRRIVLSKDVLQFLLLYKEPLLTVDGNFTNSQLRHCAYRCYTTWRFGSKDLADFAILPSCCRWKIRREFPKSDGQYSGFKNNY
ncbi:P2X purinoceptor 7 [Suncus etruscus]|uniref:P2X purinoceptor 7 n=1 Tax=Suncus etruscus TaxID=109475 RepID=UPI002110B4DB|nr:P2X purinoceptor 7 [Suncus etruscus]